MQKIRVKRIEFLEFTKKYERMLKITLSNRYVLFATATYTSWAEGDGVENARVAQAVVDQYSEWLRFLVD